MQKLLCDEKCYWEILERLQQQQFLLKAINGTRNRLIDCSEYFYRLLTLTLQCSKRLDSFDLSRPYFLCLGGHLMLSPKNLKTTLSTNLPTESLHFKSLCLSCNRRWVNPSRNWNVSPAAAFWSIAIHIERANGAVMRLRLGEGIHSFCRHRLLMLKIKLKTREEKL